MGDQIYKCPLCGSILVRDHWVKITGQWEAEQKRAEDIKKKLEQFKKEKLLLEKEVAKMLSENFPDDEIKSTGKLGDNIQIVRHKDQEAGSILYECKKTSKYDNSFVLEAKRHQETAGCNYAVVVTHAVKSGKSRFFIDGEVIVIDPLGLLDLAFLL